METAELTAEKREVTGKESSKKLRRAGRAPAVLYSDGSATPISVDAREFSSLIHSASGTNVIVKLKIAGVRGQSNAIIKEIQRNPLRDEFFNIDFQKIAMDEKITAMVPVVLVGEAPGVKAGGVLEHHLWEVELEGLPTKMPDRIELDVSELEIGGSVHVRDIALPDGITAVTDGDVTVLLIAAPKAAAVAAEAVEEIAPEAVAGGGEAAAAEEEAAAE